jgi:hypothetical protein
MFGQPIAGEAEALGETGEIKRVAQRLSAG